MTIKYRKVTYEKWCPSDLGGIIDRWKHVFNFTIQDGGRKVTVEPVKGGECTLNYIRDYLVHEEGSRFGDVMDFDELHGMKLVDIPENPPT